VKNKNVVITVVIALIIGAGGFFGGIEYQKSKTPAPRGFGNMSAEQRTQFGARAGRSGVPGGDAFSSGQIISKDDKSITVKDQNGSTKIVYFSDSTQINKADKGTTNDLSIGQNVTVSGKSNSDGSLAADSIQIRPAQNQ